MAANVSVEDQGEYLLVKQLRGGCKEDCIACIGDVYDAAARLEKRKVLVDSTAIPEPFPTMATYEIGECLANRDTKYPIQLAIVFLHTAVLPDRFFQNIAMNRGARMRMFVEDFDAAVSWLTDE